MKLVFVKILCWVAGIGTVGYIGLTIAKSIPSINGLVASIPVIKQIPTPVIEPLAKSAYNCKSDYGEYAETVRIADAPESEGSYPRWGCPIKNPNKSEDEYQEYLTRFVENSAWQQNSEYNPVAISARTKSDCEYHDGIYYEWAFGQGSTTHNFACVNPLTKDYQGDLENFNQIKANYIIYELIDYSKE